MKSQASFRELKKHGSYDYPFEKYDIISDCSKQLATNHWHNETEIVYVTSGCIAITVNGESFFGKPGDIFIINSGEIHEIYGSVTPLEYTAFVFDFDMLSFRKADFAQQNFIEPVSRGEMQFSSNVRSSEKAYALLKYINEINTARPACYTLSTKAALICFFALMIEENRIALVKHPSSNDEKKLFLKKIVKYMNENYTKEITLTEAAKRFNMSHKYFCRFFKNNFNKTFVEYLNDLRIENSMRMLSEGNISVTEAAISCGFCNMSYFTRTFKKKTGCTPSQYKKSEISKYKFGGRFPQDDRPS